MLRCNYYDDVVMRRPPPPSPLSPLAGHYIVDATSCNISCYTSGLRRVNFFHSLTLSESLDSVLSINPPLFAFSGALFAYSIVLGSSYWLHFLFCCINMSHYSSMYLVHLGELSRPFWSFLLDSGMCGTFQSCIGSISW